MVETLLEFLEDKFEEPFEHPKEKLPCCNNCKHLKKGKLTCSLLESKTNYFGWCEKHEEEKR